MSKIVERIEKLRAIHSDLLRIEPFQDIGLVGNPGATLAQIEAAEARIGMRLPPSYREFLRLHDGFPRFFEGTHLLGTRSLGDRSHDAFARAAFAGAESPAMASTPGLASTMRRRRGFERVIPFGVDPQATTLFAFNPDVSRTGGECEVIAWIHELGVRRPDFASFLDLLIEFAEHERTRAGGGSATSLRASA
ncbi:MAG TPA: SMI1/KNR4 family protein [Polyangiaceae bacterium]|nr:SMI1/KNR4 family protein [Polyangiaceae bacterium]